MAERTLYGCVFPAERKDNEWVVSKQAIYRLVAKVMGVRSNE